jgi:N-formylmaleamate deformylase
MTKSSWTTGSCAANGIDVHFLRTGGDKPPVVMLHGLTANGACWTPLARALEDEYDVVMPDARGHGRSSAPDRGYRYEELAADVASFVDALGLTAPVLLGHSMGGMTAAVVASRSSERLRGLVLVDPTFLTPQRQREVYESDVAEQHRQTLRRSRRDLLSELSARHAHRSPELVELLVQARLQTDVRAFEVLAPPNPDYAELVDSIAVPTLLVVGDDGSVVAPEVAAELAAHHEHLQVTRIAKAGHGIPYDRPEHLAAVVRAFLGSVSRARGG